MKNVLLILFTTVMFGIAGNAQGNQYLKSSMVILVNQARNTYTDGLSYKDWLIKQIGTTTIGTIQEEKFLTDVYEFLASNDKSVAIYKNYDGNSLLELKRLYDKGGTTILTSNNQRCGWLCNIIIIIFFPGLNEILDTY